MATKGYAKVSYRELAAAAGVSAALVQYYFPSLDDIFLAALRRRAGENLTRLRQQLDTSRDPVRTIWEFSRREATGAVMAEFLALGNHRTAVAAEIATITTEVRAVQLKALGRLRRRSYRLTVDLEALIVLLNGAPKLLQLEEGTGIHQGHEELVAAIEALVG